MQTHEVLTAAADLLSKPGAWTQGVLARSKSGKTVSYGDGRACAWCVMGAIAKVSGHVNGRVASPAKAALRSIVGPYLPTWNDRPGRDQFDVVSALREAAALAREKSE